jgi:hypothetical protein
VASIAALRDALQTRIATVSGLRAYDTWPSPLMPPAALVRPADPMVEFEEVLGPSTQALYHFEVHVAVGLGDLRSAQDALDGYLSPSGSASVPAAILGDRTLGGLANGTWVRRARQWGSELISGVEVLGAILDVDVDAG